MEFMEKKEKIKVPQRKIFDKFVENEIKKGVLTGKEIKEALKNIHNPENSRSVYDTASYPEKTFNQTLIRFIERGKIQVCGYNFTGTKQDFKADDLIFISLEQDPIKIRALLNKLKDNTDEEEILMVKNQLRSIFMGKFNGIIQEQIDEWNYTKDRLGPYEIPDEVLLWLNASRVYNYYKQRRALKSFQTMRKINFIKHNMEKSRDKLSELREKYSYLKVRLLQGEELEKIIPFEDETQSTIFRRMYLVNIPNEKGLEQEESSVKNNRLNEDSFSDEEFLERYLGYSKPTERTQKEKEILFRAVFQYIYLNPNDILFEKLSYALSNDKESLKFIKEIIEEVTDRKKSL